MPQLFHIGANRDAVVKVDKIVRLHPTRTLGSTEMVGNLGYMAVTQSIRCGATIVFVLRYLGILRIVLFSVFVSRVYRFAAPKNAARFGGGAAVRGSCRRCAL